MLKIVIVDDEVAEVEKTRLLLAEYCEINGISDLCIETFSSPVDFLAAFQAGGRADVYFFDIVMPDMNGIELGVAVKKTEKSAKIIFLTTSEEYGIASYDVPAIDYCLKPCTIARLTRALGRVLAIRERENTRRFLIKLQDGNYSFLQSEIVYIEYYDHRMLVHTKDGKIIESATYREPFSSLVEPLLKESDFLRISTSYIINMAHVIKLHANEFEMRGKQKLLISRKYLDGRSAYINYMLEKN